jgi:hypothetical protein
MVMGVDIAGGGKDDTAIVIVEHSGTKRYLRYHEAVTDAVLRDAGITPTKARNPSAIADRIQQLFRANDVDQVITDATNIGEGFDSEIRETIGRGVNAFNFSDSESVSDMFHNLNYGFHNGQISLVEDETLTEQLLAIVKDKTKKGSYARFSGKDHAPEGKDDIAIALTLAAYPPNISTEDKNLKTEDDSDEQKSPQESLGTSRLNVNQPDDSSSGSKKVVHSKGRGSSRRDYELTHQR